MSDDQTHWKALQRNWRMQCAASLLLPVALVWFLGDWEPAWPDGAMLLFVVGLASVAPTLWRFRRYKQALIKADAQSATPEAEQRPPEAARIQSANPIAVEDGGEIGKA